jgi:hypothetical protein
VSQLRGLVAGGLMLTALEVLVSNRAAAQNASGAIGLVSTVINRLVDPAVPLIPDRNPSLQSQHPGDVVLAN